MPVLEKDAKYYDYVPIFLYAHPRIDAGIKFLRSNGYKKIVLLAHSCGVHMAMSWLRENGDSQIDAFIGLGMGATDYKQPMQQSFPLDKLSVPVLDLYGESEYPAVIGMAPARMLAIEAAGNKLSAQVELAGADHYFTDQDEALVEAVTEWLQSL
jgi:pimeloyl-ACP methyl ester carboxylesterase